MVEFCVFQKAVDNIASPGASTGRSVKIIKQIPAITPIRIRENKKK